MGQAEAQEPQPWQRSLALFPAEVLADVVVFIEVYGFESDREANSVML